METSFIEGNETMDLRTCFGHVLSSMDMAYTYSNSTNN